MKADFKTFILILLIVLVVCAMVGVYRSAVALPAARKECTEEAWGILIKSGGAGDFADRGYDMLYRNCLRKKGFER